MKKLIFSAAVMASAFFAASCQQEMLDPQAGGNTVTYTVEVPNAIATKAIGDQITNVDKVYYEVYRAAEVDDLTKSPVYEGNEPVTGNQASFDLEFVKNQEFVVLFWAQNSSLVNTDVTSATGMYNINDLRAIRIVNPGAANNESAQVFAGSDRVANSISEANGNVRLTRPVSQVNVYTTKESLNFGDVAIGLNTSSMTVAGLYNTFNVAAGDAVAADENKATFTYAAAAVPTAAADNADHKYVAMNYVGFAPKAGATVNVDFTIKTTEAADIVHSVSNVPVKPNYRTNIVGNLISATTDYNVSLNDDWTAEEITCVCDAAALQAAIVKGGRIEFANDITVDKWIMFSETKTIGTGQIITVPMNGLTIDGNGHTLTVKSIESAGNGNLLFDDASNLNIHDLTIKYADGLTGGGFSLETGVISKVNFIGGRYGIYPGSGEIMVEECTFATNADALYFEQERDNLTVTGCTFNQPAGTNVILLRGDVQFTNNIINSGRTVNIVSGSPVVTGNNFNNVRLKVYAAATATVSGNIIGNLVFETDTHASTFTNNIFTSNVTVPENNTEDVVLKTETVEVTVPASVASAGDSYKIEVSNENTATDPTTGETSIAFDLTMYKNDVKVSGETIYEVALNVGAGKIISEVTHNGAALANANTGADQTYKYDSATGKLTIYTKSFSPFAVTYADYKDYVRTKNFFYGSYISVATGSDLLPIVAVNPEITKFSVFDGDTRITDAVTFRFSDVKKETIDENSYKVSVNLAIMDADGNDLELKPGMPSTINEKEYLHVYMNLYDVPAGYSVSDVKVNGTALTKSTKSNPGTGGYLLGVEAKDVYFQSKTAGLIEVTLKK